MYGIEMHILQDEKTDEILENIFGQKGTDYLHYVLNCGILDFYFSNKSGSYIYTDFLDKFDFGEVSSGLNLKSIGEFLKIPNDKIELSCNAVLSGFYNFIGKESLSAYDELIIKTYKSLGLEITQKYVYKQQANCVGAVAIVSAISGKQNFQAEIGPKIESECEKIADLCASSLKEIF